MCEETYQCIVCKKSLSPNDAYEYRGVFACEEHFDEACSLRDKQRNKVIAIESKKTKPLHGLDFGDNPIGKENKKILSHKLKQVRQESPELIDYEKRN